MLINTLRKPFTVTGLHTVLHWLPVLAPTLCFQSSYIVFPLCNKDRVPGRANLGYLDAS